MGLIEGRCAVARTRRGAIAIGKSSRKWRTTEGRPERRLSGATESDHRHLRYRRSACDLVAGRESGQCPLAVRLGGPALR